MVCAKAGCLRRLIASERARQRIEAVLRNFCMVIGTLQNGGDFL